MKKRGFTLIELLVVISIIGLMSSVVLANLNSVRAKARDARRVADFNELRTALGLYFDKNGKYPNETPVGVAPWADNFTSMSNQLVAGGFLASVPIDPTNDFIHAYAYYNYGGTIGGLLVTYLETAPSNTTGVSPSCRPFANNWCSSINPSQNYCICNPY